MSSEKSFPLCNKNKISELSININSKPIKVYKKSYTQHKSVRGDRTFPKIGWIQSCFFCLIPTSKFVFYTWQTKTYKIYCCTHCKKTNYLQWVYEKEEIKI